MRSELEPIWRAIESCDLPADVGHLFPGCADLERVAFSLQETYIIDYKDKSPRKFSDEFGASIMRLAAAFHNTYGGIIVFGVDDTTRESSGLPVSLDVEAFNSVMKEYFGVRFEAVYRKYALGSGVEIGVLLTPKRSATPPVRLLRKVGGYPAGTIWIRERHEVLAVNPDHLPTLYSKRDVYPSEDVGSSAIQRSLPPKPATIKRFVGREEILCQLWDWAIFGDQPRVYLHGPGGSGKSAIAYEFASSISNTDSQVQFSNGQRLDYVVFLSSKETELDTETGKVREFHYRQFEDTSRMYISLLKESGFKEIEELVDLSEDQLESEIINLFDEYSGIIVFDDIDALSRRGLDTGEEFIFQSLVQAKRRTRAIYTLRQVPQHARRSAIHVPGLSEVEFFEFTEVARQQFGVAEPKAEDIPAIMAVTNSLPLLIENVLGLRKFCGSYREALRQHEDKGGDDARRYLYQREYDHLEKRGKSREVMAVLALLREPIRFTTLADLMDLSRQVVIDALTECSNIFLLTEEDSGGETVYMLSPVARPFIDEVSRGMAYFDQIKRKVELFRNKAASPAETAMLSRLERFLRSEQYQAATQLWESIGPEDVLKANPEIRAAVGRAYANVGSHQRTKAIECFRYAESMGFFDIGMMRSWYFILGHSGAPVSEIEALCQGVLARTNLADKYRAEFYNKLGNTRIKEARALQFGVREKALPLFAGAIRAFMKNLYIAQINDLESSKTLHALSATCNDFLATCRGDLDSFFKALESLADEKHDLSVEGVSIILDALGDRRYIPFSPEALNKMRGYLRRTQNRYGRAVVAISKGAGGQLMINGLARIEAAI